MRISEPSIRAIVKEIIARTGSEDEEAAMVTDHLVGANLAGHDSHGVGLVPTYVRHFEMGLLKPNTPAALVSDSGAFLLFDGQRGYGRRTAGEAMEAGIVRARDSGVAVVGIRNAHHIGRIGTYGEQAMAAGMVSLHFVNVIDHGPMVAPFRGADARYSTNPVCIAIPGTENTPPTMLDMATSKIALGKTRVAMNKGEQVADGMLIDHQGQPTTEPGVMFHDPKGALTPFGEHKGYGMALMCEILAGILTGGGTIQPGNDRLGSIVNCMLAFVVDPARLVDQDWMRAEIDAVIDYVKASPAAREGEPVLVPGDPERAHRLERTTNGLPIDDTTWEEILEAGEKVGLSRGDALAMVA